MAVSRVKTSSVLQGFAKYRTMLAGNDAYLPGAYESIASATGTGSSGTITFSSIPSTYASLQIRLSAISTVDNDGLRMTLNNLGTNSYTYHLLNGDAATVTATGSGFTGGDFITLGYSRQTMISTPKVAIVDIHNYASTTQLKTVRIFTGMDRNNTGNDLTLQSSLVNTTSAISSLQFFLSSGSFNSGTTIALYGIKGA